MTMIQFDNNFTTPEQSKLLLGLGVPADSCDSYYIAEDEAMPNWLPYKKGYSEWRKEAFGLSHGYTEIIPCWSVGRLIEIHTVCAGASSSYYISAFPTNILNEVMWHLTEAVRHGWIDFSKLEG